MYKLILTAIVAVVLGGCAQETTYVDQEWGKAQMDAFDQQIAYKNGEFADKTPSGMAGIHSEKIMDTYQNSFDRSSDNESNFTRGMPDLTSDKTEEISN